MQIFKRTTAILMIILTVFTILPMQIFAVENDVSIEQSLNDAEATPVEQTQTVEKAESESPGANSTNKAPEDREEFRQEQQELLEEAQRLSGKKSNKRILLIQDNYPWDTTTNEQVLSSICEYKKVTTTKVINNDFGEYDIGDFAVIVLANDQGFSTYSNYIKFRKALEIYASGGGVIIFGACDEGWENGTLTEDLPGGVQKVSNYEYYNYINDYSHPVINAVYSSGNALTNDDLYHNYCSHDYFLTSTLPKGANIIIRNSSGYATLAEYPMGKGMIIASGLTWEHNYYYAERNGHGPFAKKIYDDLILYALSKSNVDKEAIESLMAGPLDKDRFNVYVSDSSGKPIKNAKVTVDGVTSSTNESGYAYFDVSDGFYQIKTAATNYKTRLTEGDGGAGKLVPVTLTEYSSTKPYIVGFTASKSSDENVDLLSQRYYIKEKAENAVKLNIHSELNGKTLKHYKLYSKNGAVTFTGSSYNFKPDSTFIREETIYLQIVCTDGTVSDPVKTYLTVKSSSDADFKLWGDKFETEFTLGNEFSWTVGEKIPFFSGTKFSMDLKFFPLTFEVKEGHFKAAFDSSEHEKFGEYVDGVKEKIKTVKTYNKLKEVASAFGAKGGSFTIAKGWKKPEMYYAGYLEGQYNDQAEVHSLEGQFMIGGKLAYELSKQFLLGGFPVYFTTGFEGKIEVPTTVKNLNFEKETIELESAIEFTPKISAEGGAGINGAISAGVEGALSWPVKWKPAVKHIFMEMVGTIKLKASLLFVFKAEKEVVEGKLSLIDKYYGSQSGDESLLNEEAVAVLEDAKLDISDESVYKPLDRSYLAKTTEWGKNEDAVLMSGNGNAYSEILQQYILPDSIPRITKLSNGNYLMIFQADNGRDNFINCTTLMYSVSENGIDWSYPEAVWFDENGIESDYYADVVTKGEKTYLVWQRSNFKTEDVLENIESSDLGQYIEICSAVFDEDDNKFVSQTYLTSDSYYQGSPVAVIDESGNCHAVWVENRTNNLFATEDATYNIYSYTDSKSTLIGQTVNMPLSVDAEFVDSKLNVAFCADTDKDIGTAETNSIYLLSDKVLTEVAKADGSLNPQIVDSRVYWFNNGNIMSCGVSDKTAVTELSDVTSGYRVLNNENGLNIVWHGSDETDSFAKFAIKEESGWSKVKNIHSFNGVNLFAFDVIYDEGKWYLVFNASDAEETENNCLVYTVREAYRDISVDDITVDESKRNDNGIQPVEIYVTNNGTRDITEDDTLYFSDNLYNEYEINASIPVGESVVITVNADFDYVDYDMDYACNLYLDNEDNNENNRVETKVGYNDISVSVQNEYINNGYNLYTVVKNLNSYDADVTLTIREDGHDGEVILTRNLGVLEGQESKAMAFNVDRGLIDFDENGIKTLSVSVSTSDEINLSDNNALISVVSLENEIRKIELNDGSPYLSYDLTQAKNKVYTVKRSVVPAEAADDLVWQSSNPSVVSVSDDGKITIKAAGEAVISASSPEGDISSSVTVYVVNPDKTAPTEFKVVSNGIPVKLSWKAVSNTSNYEILRSTSAKGTYEVLARTSATTFSDSMVEIGKTYYYKVRTYINNYGTYIYGNNTSAITVKVTLGTPELSVYQSTPGAIALSWNAVSNAEKYKVYRKTSSAKSYSLITTTTSRYYTDSKVTPGVKYTYAVSACKGKIEGTKSTAKTFETKVTAPSYISVYNDSYNTLRVYVNMSCQGATGYQIYRATSEKGSYSLVKTTNTYNYYDTGLSFEKTYYYKARTFFKSGSKTYYSEFSPIAYNKATLSYPYNIRVTVAGESKAYLTWDAVDGAQGYTVYRSNSYSGEYVKVKSVTSTSFTDSSLTADKYYYYKVAAYRKSGSKTIYSPMSSYYSVRPYFSTPYDVKVTSSGLTTHVLSYKIPAGAKGVEIYCDSGKGYELVKKTTATSYTFKNLDANRYYYYRVRAYKTVGNETVYSSYYSLSYKSLLPAPGNLKAVNKNTTSIALTWSAVKNATIYYIYRSTSPTGSFYQIASSEKASYTDTSVQTDIVYYYKVEARRNVNGYVNSGTLSAPVRKVALCATTKITSIIPESLTSVSIKWNKTDEAVSYRLYRATSKTGTYSLVKSGIKGTSYIDKSLKYGKTYYYKLKVSAAPAGVENISDYSAVVAGKTGLKKPVLSVHTTSVSGITLKWSKNSEATGYGIYRATSKNGKYTLIANIGKNSTVAYTDTQVKAGSSYYYKMVTFKKSGKTTVKSSYSSVVTAKAVPYAVSGLKVTGTTVSSVSLAWNKNTAASGYYIYRATSKNGKYSLVATIKKNSTVTYTNSKLKAGSTYYYKIVAYKTLNGKTYKASASSVVSAKALPKAVSGLKVAATSVSAVKLIWTKNSTASGYYVYRATSKSGSYSLVATINKNTTVSYTNSKLKAGTTYYYKVIAFKTVSGKIYKASASDVVSAKTVPSTPKSLKVAGVTSSAVKLSWAKNSTAEGYYVYRATSKSGSYSLVGTVKKNSTVTFTDTKLKSKTTYYYKLVAYKTVSGTIYKSAATSPIAAKTK